MATVAQVMVQALKDLGVKYIFGVPSGNWVDFLHEIQMAENIEFILVSNEGSAGFMADVCWRLTGQPAACFGTLGPGACNLTTGVCGGFLDRAPMIAFTDEMNDAMLHRTSQMNIDHQSLFKPITKWTTRLKPGRVKETLYKAFEIATAEVPGPVHVGLPLGIGLLENGYELDRPLSISSVPEADTAVLDRAAALLSAAEKPVVALGITAVRSDVRDRVMKLVEKINMPVVLTPMAKGMLPEDHPCYAGVLNHALGHKVGVIHQQADLIVGIGYDPVEVNYEEWIPNVPVVHIDTVAADLDPDKFTLACDVVGDLTTSIQWLIAKTAGPTKWDLESLVAHKEKLFSELTAESGEFGAVTVLNGLRALLPSDGIMTCDVGAHLHLIGQHWKTETPDCQLMTNGCSSMGFAIPAAIAAKHCCPERAVCCVVGDGGYYMMAGEMATAVRNHLHVVFVVMMDASLSLIRIKQSHKRHVEYGVTLNEPPQDSATSGSLFDVPVLRVNNHKQYQQALGTAFDAKGPSIIEVLINTKNYDNLVLKGNK
jgi:acetolactate synthase-1/2/3 large subunit